jgi:hypothetical protein
MPRLLTYAAAALAYLRRKFAGPPDLPDPPPAGVREPRRRGPSGRASSVAVLEPEDLPRVEAVADRLR